MTTQLHLNGSHGEGDGQILRTALALSAVTGRAIGVEKTRAGGKNPGLAAQHLTAVRAGAAICGAEVGGNKIGSQEVTLSPKSRPPNPATTPSTYRKPARGAAPVRRPSSSSPS